MPEYLKSFYDGKGFYVPKARLKEYNERWEILQQMKDYLRIDELAESKIGLTFNPRGKELE